jgi:hypothetical protein
MARTTSSRPRSKKGRLAAATAVAAAVVLVPATPAAAHHGWDGFDTDRLVYIGGTVSSDGSWGEPHSYFDVTLDSELPADTPDLEIPEDLQAPEDSSRVEAALAYDGTQETLEVIIAPPAWSGPWGLDRPLEVGERFQGVGYINRSDDGLFRPVAFWYGDDDVPVNQVLGSTLPAHPPLPGSDPSTPATVPTATAPDPLETTAPRDESATPAVDAQAPAEEQGTATWAVWSVFGLVVVTAVAGGLFYLRRRSRQE